MLNAKLGIEISKIVKAKDPLQSVARGCLIAAKTHEGEKNLGKVKTELEQEFGSIYAGLETAVKEGEAAYKSIKLPDKWQKALTETAKEKIEIPKISITANLELQSFAPNGAVVIREALDAAMKKHEQKEIEIILKYIGAPKYKIQLTGDDYKIAEKLLDSFSNDVFESLKAAYRRSGITMQGLLVPERLELTHREAGILETLLKDLTDMGLEIEPFGGNTCLIKSVPALLAGRPIEPLVMEIVEKAAEIGLASGLRHGVDECLSLIACHGAIRANQKLADEQMKALLKQLDTLEHASHCPHGRPTYVHRTLRQVEKDFKRII